MTEEFVVYKNIPSRYQEKSKLERQIIKLPRNQGHLKLNT